jgi:YHS domain-containing protein
MRIFCDACGAQVDQETAVVLCDEAGELFYFCSEECVESAESLEPDGELERMEPRER